MAFELRIAAQRDPATACETAVAQVPTTSLPVATLDVSGEFCCADAAELERRVADVLGLADTVIIRFAPLATEDAESLALCMQWIERLRRDGRDVRVAAGEPGVAALLAQAAVSAEALIDPAEADGVARRRALDAHP